MGVALVADVKNKLVFGGIENVVECYSCLDKTKVRTYVSAMFAHTIEYGLACFGCHRVEGFNI